MAVLDCASEKILLKFCVEFPVPVLLVFFDIFACWGDFIFDMVGVDMIFFLL